MDHHDRDIVVIGASAGGIRPLVALVAELPETYDGTVFIVVHIGSHRSALPSVLSRSTMLPVSHAIDREPIRSGHIYVAPPDHHLLVHRTGMELSHGPRENHSRPAIDPLFRSAARAFGERVIGVILSGALSDGAAGLLAVKGHGGTVVVQDPDEAVIESMPISALRSVEADYVLTAREIGQLLAGSARKTARPEEGVVDESAVDQAVIAEDFSEQEQDQRGGELTMFTCPDCGGTLWQSRSNSLLGFQCHVGHMWNGDSLLSHKTEEVEAALWSSVRLFEERATLSRQVAARLRQTGQDRHRVSGIEEQATLDESRADAIRQLLSVSLTTPLDDDLSVSEIDMVD